MFVINQSREYMYRWCFLNFVGPCTTFFMFFIAFVGICFLHLNNNGNAGEHAVIWDKNWSVNIKFLILSELEMIHDHMTLYDMLFIAYCLLLWWCDSWTFSNSKSEVKVTVINKGLKKFIHHCWGQLMSLSSRKGLNFTHKCWGQGRCQHKDDIWKVTFPLELFLNIFGSPKLVLIATLTSALLL
jgi:hypothetical protein